VFHSDGKQLEHNSSLEEGRTVRKATGPIPIFAPKRKPKLQDLRQKLAKRLPPHLASTPKTEAKIRKVEEIQGSNKEPQMGTTGNLFTKRHMKHTQSNLFLDINLIPNGFKGTINNRK
jgi:hypothetical protein